MHPVAAITFANVKIKGTPANISFSRSFGFDIRFSDKRPEG
jgi:hypothetical protein